MKRTREKRKKKKKDGKIFFRPQAARGRMT